MWPFSPLRIWGEDSCKHHTHFVLFTRNKHVFVEYSGHDPSHIKNVLITAFEISHYRIKTSNKHVPCIYKYNEPRKIDRTFSEHYLKARRTLLRNVSVKHFGDQFVLFMIQEKEGASFGLRQLSCFRHYLTKEHSNVIWKKFTSIIVREREYHWQLMEKHRTADNWLFLKRSKLLVKS